jgi:hypothetical protein
MRGVDRAFPIGSTQRAMSPLHRVLCADADEDRHLLMLIVARLNVPMNGTVIRDARVIGDAMHRFAAKRVIGINHLCGAEGCQHTAREHVAQAARCTASGCLCAGYVVMRAPVQMVESFQWLGDRQEAWNGRPLAEPFEFGDGVITLKSLSPMLWAMRDYIVRGASLEGRGAFVE